MTASSGGHHEKTIRRGCCVGSRVSGVFIEHDGFDRARHNDYDVAIDDRVRASKNHCATRNYDNHDACR